LNIKNKYLDITIKYFPVLIIWWLIAVIYNNKDIFPTPWQVIVRFTDILNFSELKNAILSFITLIISYALTIFISLFLSILTINRNKTKNYIKGILSFLIKIPNIAYVTYFILFLGIGYPTIVSVILTAAIPITSLHIISVFENLNYNTLIISDLYEIPFFRRVKYFYIPSLFESFNTIFVTSFSISFKSLIMAEFLGGLGGLGYGLVEKKESFQMDILMAYILFITILGIFFQNILEFLLNKVKDVYYKI
jgi:NitT/TauT family transport system permease protein